VTPERLAEIRRIIGTFVCMYRPGPTIADAYLELLAAVKRLTRWKAEALIVLTEWDRVHVAAGSPEKLGESRATATLAAVDRLTAERDEARSVAAKWRNRVDGVQPAMEPLPWEVEQ
jgi:hypothetical protein